MYYAIRLVQDPGNVARLSKDKLTYRFALVLSESELGLHGGSYLLKELADA
jgi:hypothetical protein